MAINHDLQEFMLEVEEDLIRIQQVSESEDSEGILLQAELLLRNILLVEGLLQRQDGELMVDVVVEVIRNIQRVVDECHYQLNRGRPQIPICEQQLLTLLELQFSNHDIASLLQVSTRTIRRRILQFGLQDVATFSEMGDAELDAITSQFVHTHPNSGERSLAGFLRGDGIRIQRSRVRDSLLRVDPRGVQTRFRTILHRRRYYVCMLIVCGTLMGITS